MSLKPKPTQLRIIQGNPGKRPLNKKEPKPAAATTLRCPAHITGEARKEWRRVCKVLGAARVLTEADRSALELYCDAYQTWFESTDKVREDGMVCKTENGYLFQNPHLAIANKARDTMLKIMVEFGMTPSSRTRIQVQGESKKGKGSPFAGHN